MSYRPRGGKITEQAAIAAAELMSYIKHLLTEGNERRLIIRKPGGEVLLEVPLVASIAVAGVVTLLVPLLAAIAAVAALVAKVQVDIVHRGNGKD